MDVGFCAFPDAECPSGYRWDSSAGNGKGGTCVLGEVPSDSGSENACGGTVVLPNEPGTPCGACLSGTTMCSGENSVECSGALRIAASIAREGTAEATSVFPSSGDLFVATRAIDDDLSTSWFGGEESKDGVTFTWMAPQEDCLQTLTISGNRLHADTTLRRNFGFGQVEITIFDAEGAEVFSSTQPLASTPDPDVMIRPDQRGQRIELHFTGQESDERGGFAELAIQARR